MVTAAPFLPPASKFAMIHIDIETFSSEDLKTAGVHRYAAAPDFEILLFAYSVDGGGVTVIDLAAGETIPDVILRAMAGTAVLCAHNAEFERVCLAAIGIVTKISQWVCTARMSAYAGVNASLSGAGKALKIPADKAKLAIGKKLIKLFCIACKPTKKNGYRRRNLPYRFPLEWISFKLYCAGDVVAEKAIHKILTQQALNLPRFEQAVYALDQKINTRGVRLDLDLVTKAAQAYEDNKRFNKAQLKSITGLDNPNSPSQLAGWLSVKLREDINSVNAATVEAILSYAEDGEVIEALELRKKLSTSSNAKYAAAMQTVAHTGRVYGMFMYYGASRTGRWAGRKVQPHNLPRPQIDGIEIHQLREAVKSGLDVPSKKLSQLLRSMFIPSEGRTFIIADYSAIEARVTAWLANESWRLDVFKTHGKIYEASASAMFGVPMEEITKGSDMRAKGKVAELALGFGGGVGALVQMGGEDMGMTEQEMKATIKAWRKASPNIVQFWRDLDKTVKLAISKGHAKLKLAYTELEFIIRDDTLRIKLPSGRCLVYRSPKVVPSKKWEGSTTIQYLDATNRGMERTETYGGKLCENIVQAVARDLLADAMLRMDARNVPLVMHVHDEVVADVPLERVDKAKSIIEKIMSAPPQWAAGIPVTAEADAAEYYCK